MNQRQRMGLAWLIGGLAGITHPEVGATPWVGWTIAFVGVILFTAGERRA